jgi:S1-C subfamily serine protease
MLRRSVTRLAAFTLVAVALLAAACGDDDDGAATVDDVYVGALETRLAVEEEGLEVVRVEDNSPVSSSGLARGDVITAVDGERMEDPDELDALLAELAQTHDAGDKVVIAASGEEFTVRLAANIYLGAQLLAPVGGDRGARVGGVPGGTPADAAGLQRDDLITAVDGDPVSSSNQLIQALAEHQPDDEVELTVSRGAEELTVPVTLQPRG